METVEHQLQCMRCGIIPTDHSGGKGFDYILHVKNCWEWFKVLSDGEGDLYREVFQWR